MRGIRAMPVLFAALLAQIAPVPAGPELWLSAEPPAPRPGEPVVVKLLQGEPFAGSEAGVEGRLLRVWKGGRQKAAGSFQPQEPGVQLFVYDDGKGRHCKALVVVGEAHPDDPIRYSEVGHALEIVPQTDPVDLLRGAGELEVQVLFEHEPLAGVIVAALPQSSPRQGRRTAATDEIGLARFKIDRPGPWMIRVVHPAARARATLVLQAGGGR